MDSQRVPAEGSFLQLIVGCRQSDDGRWIVWLAEGGQWREARPGVLSYEDALSRGRDVGVGVRITRAAYAEMAAAGVAGDASTVAFYD